MKQTQLEKVIAALEAKKVVLDLAIAELEQALDAKPKRVRKPKAIPLHDDLIAGSRR